jgi:4-hydroxy-tetrahydrodipicolinate synthase
MTEIKGVIAALVTPFTLSGELVPHLLEQHIDYLIDMGVHALAACGSAGEFEALSFDELVQVYRIVVERAGSRVPTIGGVGGRSTQEAIRMIRAAEACGLDAVLVFPPHYSGYEFNEEEILAYFSDIAAATHLVVMLYNRPGRTTVSLPPHLVARLAELANIRYIKEGTADIRYVGNILQATHEDIVVVSGWDSIVLESLLMGAKGLFSGIANVVPEILITLYNLTVQKNYEEALTYYRKIRPLLVLLEDKGRFVAWLKAGMRLRNRDGGFPRKPYLPASEAERMQIRQALIDADIDVS